MRPCSWSRTNTSTTALDILLSIVKYSLLQSIEAPRRRIWRVMVLPEDSFQSHTFSKNFSRPKSWRETFWASSWRSTTIWVAIPAWSVPGTHKVFLPDMRAWRTRPSMMVWLKACPMCRVPVTLGGGSWIEKSSLPSNMVASAIPLRSHSGPQ